MTWSFVPSIFNSGRSMVSPSAKPLSASHSLPFESFTGAVTPVLMRMVGRETFTSTFVVALALVLLLDSPAQHAFELLHPVESKVNAEASSTVITEYLMVYVFMLVWDFLIKI